MSIVEFGEPPVSRRDQKRQRWQAAANELRNRPMQWGKVGIYSPGIATALRKGYYKQFLDGKPEEILPDQWMRQMWEIHAVKVADHKKDEIWMRWLG